MADNAQKTWFGRDLNRFAEQKALDALQLTGKALPASVVSVAGSIVTVQFEISAAPFTLPQVTVPILGPEYIRFPTQVGDKGFVVPADARLGAMSGLGKGTASLALPANLSALVFAPFGNKGWSATDDAQAVVIYGPHGAILRTVSGGAKFTVNADGIVANFGGKTFTLNGSGMTIDCDVVITGGLSSSGTTGLGGGAKKVVLDGDSVVAGVVVASSTKTTAE